MIITASNGCYLTEAVSVPIDKRRFFKSLEVSSYAEASEWIEITEREMRTMQAQAELISPKMIDYDYLCRLDTAVNNLHEIINDVPLTDDQALSMIKYYPQYDDEIGQYRNAGYKMQFEGELVEVVTSHTISADISPKQQPMTLEEKPQEESAIPVAEDMGINTLEMTTLMTDTLPTTADDTGEVVSADNGIVNEVIVTAVEPIIYYRVVTPTPATLEEPVITEESEKTDEQNETEITNI